MDAQFLVGEQQGMLNHHALPSLRGPGAHDGPGASLLGLTT